MRVARHFLPCALCAAALRCAVRSAVRAARSRYDRRTWLPCTDGARERAGGTGPGETGETARVREIGTNH